jgi:predicted Zn-dependent peptidase
MTTLVQRRHGNQTLVRWIGRLGLAALLASSCSRSRDTVTSAPELPPVATESKVDEPDAPERTYPEPPGPDEPRRTHFPELQKFELPNRLKVVVVESHDVPMVDVSLVVNVGDVHDELLSLATAHLLTHGTNRRTKDEIHEELAQLGSRLSVSVGNHETALNTVVLKRHLPTALAIVSDVVRNPRLEQSLVDDVRARQEAALRQAKASAHALGNTLLFMKLYPEGHPYGRPFIREQELEALGMQAVEEFHELWYRPNNAQLVLSGAITMEEAKKIATKVFEGWKPREEEFPPYPLERFSSGDYQEALPSHYTIHIIDRKAASTEVLIGNLALARDDSNWEKMELVNHIFGAGPSSRLFQEGGLPPPPVVERDRLSLPREHSASDAALRLILQSTRATTPPICHDIRSTLGEPASLSKRFASCELWDLRDNRRLTHHVGSRVTRAKAVGAFHVATRTNEVDRILEFVFDEIDRLHGNPNASAFLSGEDVTAVTEEEFELARREISQQLVMHIETASQIAQRVRTQLTFSLADNYWRHYTDRLMAMQREEVKEIAKRYIHPIPVIVLVGDAFEIKKQIANVKRLSTADILVYDLDLQPVQSASGS